MPLRQITLFLAGLRHGVADALQKRASQAEPPTPGDFRMGCITGLVMDRRKPWVLDTPDGEVREVWRWFPGKDTLSSFHFGCLTGAALRAVMPVRVQRWVVQRLQ